MVTGQIMPTNPATAVRGPRYIVRRGKTPVLDPAAARQLLDAIDTTTVIGLRDRALIGLMFYSFARIGAAIGMRVEDAFTEPQAMGSLAREGRQAARNAVLPQKWRHTFTPTSTARASQTIRRHSCSRPTAARPASSPVTPCRRRTPTR
jgi:hypothetical protein